MLGMMVGVTTTKRSAAERPRMSPATWDGPPAAPDGYEPCRTWLDGGRAQITHLVALDYKGSNGGRPTMCGLTRFDRHENGKVVERADLPGWGMGGGVSGPGVSQIACQECWDALPNSSAHDCPATPDDILVQLRYLRRVRSMQPSARALADIDRAERELQARLAASPAGANANA